MSSFLDQMVENKKKWSIIGLSTLGLLISLYISLFIEQGGSAAFCTIGETFDCTSVINSAYGHVFGISVSELGAFYFLVVIALYAVDFYDDYVMAGVSIIGLLSIMYFIFVELIILDKFCLYCTSVHIVVIILFVIIAPESIKNSYNKLVNKK